MPPVSSVAVSSGALRDSAFPRATSPVRALLDNLPAIAGASPLEREGWQGIIEDLAHLSKEARLLGFSLATPRGPDLDHALGVDALPQSRMPARLSLGHIVPDPERALPTMLVTAPHAETEGTLIGKFFCPLGDDRRLYLPRSSIALYESEIAKELAAALLSESRPGGAVAATSASRFWLAEGSLVGHARCGGYQIAIGTERTFENFLVSTQRQIDDGELGAFTLELSGKVTPEFLRWVRGEYDEDLGPIPDVLVLYRVQMPSGEPFRIILKPSRTRLEKDLAVASALAPDDREFVDALERFFSIPANRISARFFTGRGAPEAQPEIATFDLALDAHTKAVTDWNEWVRHCVTTSPRTLLVSTQEADWADAVRAGRAPFLDLFRATIDALPEKGNFRGRDFFVLGEEERKVFERTYFERLFTLCTNELKRVSNDIDDGTALARALDGYGGPVGGYMLQLWVMLFDCMVDFRRMQKEGAKESHLYERADRFPTLDKISEVLSNVKFTRRVNVRIIDPLAPGGARNVSPKNVDALEDEFLDENIARLTKALPRDYFARWNKEDAAPFVESLEGNLAPPARPDLVPKIRETELAIRDAEAWNAALTQLFKGDGEVEFAAAKRDDIRGMALTKYMEPFRAYSQDEQALARSTLRDAKLRYLMLMEAIQPDLCSAVCQKLHSIAEDETAKLIYSIAPTGVTRISSEARVRGGASVSHADLLDGTASFGGGELILSKCHRRFTSFRDWANRERLPENRPCFLLKGTNGTGHYGVGKDVLMYTRRKIFPILEKAGISTARARIEDCLLPGVKIATLSVLAQQRRFSEGDI